MTYKTPCRIHHVDLTLPLSAIAKDEAVGSVMLVFWQGVVPLGRSVIDAGEFPLPAATLARHAATAIAAAVAARLELHRGHVAGNEQIELEALLSISPPLALVNELTQPEGSPFNAGDVSVIVCTRDRPGPLRDCLSSLIAMEPAPREIIVVDNAPDPEPLRGEIQNLFPTVIYRSAPEPGLSIARNSGLRSASGKIVAFTDDDVKVTGRWAQTLAEAFVTPGIGAVTGLVLPAELETDSQMAFELAMGRLYKGCVPRTFDKGFLSSQIHQAPEVWDIGAGANMAFRKSSLDSVGGFDERLGAGASGCSEDSEMWYRLLAAGFDCKYVPEAFVFHSHRREFPRLHRQVTAYMRGHVAALLVQYKRYGHISNLRRAFWVLPTSLARILLTALVFGDWRRVGLTLCEIRGSLAGLKPRYLLFSKLPELRETERVS